MASIPTDQEERKLRNEELTALLARCALNERRAFARLYDLSSAKLYGVVLRILIKDDLAQDCLQDAYVKVWNKAGSYRPDLAAPLTWMATIARNQALDMLRRRRNDYSFDELSGSLEQQAQEPLPLDELQREGESTILAECLNRLNEQQRQAISLAFLRGMTHEQLASHTGSPLGTVKTWVRRGLEQLKRCLEP